MKEFDYYDCHDDDDVLLKESRKLLLSMLTFLFVVVVVVVVYACSFEEVVVVVTWLAAIHIPFVGTVRMRYAKEICTCWEQHGPFFCILILV